jgi:hypothetical protein
MNYPEAELRGILLIKKCGREPEGKKTQEFGVCPAALDTSTGQILQSATRYSYRLKERLIESLPLRPFLQVL